MLITSEDESRIGFTRVARRWNGVKVIVGQSGKGGMTMAQSEQPDVVVLEAHLPDVDGMHLVKLLRGASIQRNIPIVVLGVDSSGAERRRFVQAGVDEYLTRPLNFSAVDRTVLGLLELASMR